MKKDISNYYLTLMMVFIINLTFGQWNLATNIPSSGSAFPFCLTISGKAYIGCGFNASYNVTVDNQEYNPISNTWTTKSVPPFLARMGTFSFTIGSYGYVGSGSTNGGANVLTDFWRYDPSSDTWTQMATFPGAGRIEAATFVINGKGYVVSGTSNIGNPADCWEYDPITNSWLAMSNPPSGFTSGYVIGFANGNYGYTGIGGGNSSSNNDFWRFHPASNTWLQLASLPLTPNTRTWTIGGVDLITGKGFVGLGGFSSIDKVDFWMYDFASNVWQSTTPLYNFPYGLVNSRTFNLGGETYVGTGQKIGGVENNIFKFSCNSIPTNLQTGLLSQYTFNSGSTNDFSGNAHHLTNTNAAIPATDRNGNANCAFEFDNLPNSNNQFLSTTNSAFLDGLSAYSISCWYKAKDPSRGIVDYEVLVGRDTSPLICPARQGQWSLALYDCRFAVFARENYAGQSAGVCNETEVWHHLTAIYNQVGNTLKLYRDGALQSTVTGIGGCGSSPVAPALDLGDLFIGKGFTGILDDIYIHNREITASEVTQLYTLGSSCCATTSTCTTLVTPTFAPIAPICSGDVVTPLPTTSTNTITGNWSPALDNTTTTTYTFTPTTGQCATTTTITITVNPTTTNTTTVSACDNYTWTANGQTYTASGTYTNLTTNGSGCTDTSTLVLTINNSTSSSTTTSACDSYTWAANGQTYTSSGTYTNLTTNGSGCTDTATLVLTINNSTSSSMTASACDSYTWAANGQTYTSSGTYTNLTTNGAGCTDTATLVLTINNSTSSSMTASACDNYTWTTNGQTYTASGTYTNLTTNGSGCTDTATLVLTINNSTSSSMTASACDSYTWTANGTTYTTSGTYTNVSSNVTTPCLNTATLVLTINNSTSSTMNIAACDSYVWTANGTTYITSGTYTNITTNASGCPNTETLVLTINSTSSSMTASACNNYTWTANGQTYNTSGTYSHVTTNTSGCPNTATLALTINNSTSSTTSITACNSYTWLANSQTYTSSGTYTHVTTNASGCSDTSTLVVTIVNGLTKVVNVTCGTTLNNLATTIAANWVFGAQVYRFRIKNLSTGVITFVDRTINSFALINMPGATLNTVYEIDVTVMINGVWEPCYGIPCNVTTPNPVSTIGAQCNTTLTSMTQFVFCTYVLSAIGYRFKVTNTVTGVVVIYDNVNNKFNFSLIAGSTFNTLYTVEVALQNTDGTYLPYNTACNITTPPYPTTQLIATQCSGFTPANGNQFIYCNAVTGATTYRFRLFDGTTYTAPFPNSLNRFKLNNFAGLLPSTSYFVEVAVKMASEPNFGPYGSMCKIITPAVFRVDVTYNTTLFKAIAYPNPFASSFLLDVKTSSESKIQIKVYDMLGRILEDKNLENKDLSVLEIGADYPSGVYNIIVTQDDNYNSVRVIKK